MIRAEHVAQFVGRNRAAKSCAKDYHMCHPNLPDPTGSNSGFGTPPMPVDLRLPNSAVASLIQVKVVLAVRAGDLTTPRQEKARILEPMSALDLFSPVAKFARQMAARLMQQALLLTIFDWTQSFADLALKVG